MKDWRVILVSFHLQINVLSAAIDQTFLQLIYRNLSDYTGLNQFYRNILQDLRHHRVIDTVYSPINVTKIRLNDYDEDYLSNSCYETTVDLLAAHGYEKTNDRLSLNDVQSLLPAILYTIENAGCSRQSPPLKLDSFIDVWIIGLVVLVLLKGIHFMIFLFAADHCLSLHANDPSKHTSNDNSNVQIHSPYRLWSGLGLNAFTCGLMLGTIVYHLIPHIYDVPNENFDYIYLLRGTIVFFGVYLFFIVEKLLRLRFKIDEDDHHRRKTSDTSTRQMGRLHATLHVDEEDDRPQRHSDPPARIPLHDDSEDETTNFQSKEKPLSDLPSHRKRNLILYHFINDLSNDLIYGCALVTAFSHDRLIGSVLSLMIFSEGFRRHSQTISSIGRKCALYFLLLSTGFLLIGYMVGGKFILPYIRTEYIYSVLYGAVFYTALVTLIPELNNFGHHLQVILKQINQTKKQRHLIQILVLLCQHLFLIIGMIITLVLASIWRYYQRIDIFDYVCKRDPSRMFCHRS